MTLSMRKLTTAERKRQARDEKRKADREKAVQLLRDGVSRAQVVRSTGLSRAMCDLIYFALRDEDDSTLHRLLNPARNRAGRRKVITGEECSQIKQRIRVAAARGFAIDKQTLKSLMSQIASDARVGFRTVSGTPSDDAIRAWRARNRDVTNRCAENKNSARINAERYDPVASFEVGLRDIEKRHLGIFNSGDRLCNMDETSVSSEFGRKTKVFSGTETHHGGARKQRGGKPNKHITALLAVSASGRKAAPIFIVAGNNIMGNWFKPLTVAEATSDPSLQWLRAKDWMSRDAVVLTSENGSMEKRLIKLVIQHINRFVLQFVPTELAFCLTLDGHSSREGTDWLHYGHEVNCEVFQSPSDTSHFLQPCDYRVNKSFKKAIRTKRDAMCKCLLIDLSSVRANLMLRMMGFRGITPDDITDSFTECGLWPMDYHFVHKFIAQKHKAEERLEQVSKLNNHGSCQLTKEQNVRISDTQTWADGQVVLSEQESPTTELRALEILLHERTSVNKILMQLGRAPSEPS